MKNPMYYFRNGLFYGCCSGLVSAGLITLLTKLVSDPIFALVIACILNLQIFLLGGFVIGWLKGIIVSSTSGFLTGFLAILPIGFIIGYLIGGGIRVWKLFI